MNALINKTGKTCMIFNRIEYVNVYYIYFFRNKSQVRSVKELYTMKNMWKKWENSKWWMKQVPSGLLKNSTRQAIG